ncbi:MAG: histidine phosphatase family protein [Myxococcota bacterium]
MRRLIIMRHAKSDWNTGLDDHERPLNKRGRRDAPRMADALVRLGWSPDVVICSSAQRTVETWGCMAGCFPDSVAVRIEPALYLAGLGAIQDAVHTLSDDVHTVLVLGHNPGWEGAASALSQQPMHMTTANAALIELVPTGWAEAISTPARRLHALLRPKELADLFPEGVD